VSGYLDRPAPSGLADVIEVILDKGIVIDAYVRVSLLGIELLTVDARVVIASVDTYLRFAEATNRLELEDKERGLPELVGDIGGRVVEDVAEKVVAEKVGKPVRKVKGAVAETRDKVEGAKDTVEEVVDKATEVVQDKLT
jgi:gas vesicle structural protein